MFILNYIKQNEAEFKQICTAHSIGALYLFGSSIRDDFDTQKSDVDVVVEINDENPLSKGEKLISLWDRLELFFGRKVDLVTESSLRNPIFIDIVKRSKKLIYDGERNQIAV